jgi:thioredoxin
MKTFQSILAWFLILSFSSCNSQSASVHNVNAEVFSKAVLGKDVQLIDVRTTEEYNEKHIANSKNININDSGFEKQLEAFDKSKPVYFYCLAGGRSSKASNLAIQKGFKEVYNLEGGITAWIGDKKPIEFAGEEAPTEGLTMEDYLKQVKSDKLVLVDFNAVWCGPCKVLKPIVQKVVKANTQKVQLFDIDVDKNPNIANAMNLRQIPLLILYKGGKEVWRQLGVTDAETLTALINQHSK